MKTLFGRNAKTRALVVILIASFFMVNPLSPNESGSISKAAEHVLQNPVSISDSSMRAGRRVTYDTIFLGSYPQSEVKASDSVYVKLQNATNWDICGDTVIEGKKYRRLNRAEAIGCTLDLENWYYDAVFHDFYTGL